MNIIFQLKYFPTYRKELVLTNTLLEKAKTKHNDYEHMLWDLHEEHNQGFKIKHINDNIF